MAVPVLRRARPSYPTAFCARAQGARSGLRYRTGAFEPARVAARLCQPSLAQRRRLAGRTNSARARGYFDHANLHPCAGRAAEDTGARSASAIGKLAKDILKSEINPFA